jgi:hypothetical protein
MLVLILIGSACGRAAAVAKRSDETNRTPYAARKHSPRILFSPPLLYFRPPGGIPGSDPLWWRLCRPFCNRRTIYDIRNHIFQIFVGFPPFTSICTLSSTMKSAGGRSVTSPRPCSHVHAWWLPLSTLNPANLLLPNEEAAFSTSLTSLITINKYL